MAQTHRGEAGPSEREIGRAGQPGMTANELLDDDHDRVLQLFNEYRNGQADASPEGKRQLARAICRELRVHTQIEEEIYYPRVRSKSGADELLDEAQAEHESAKELIKDIENASTHDSSFDARMKVLEEEVRHHIREERHELFNVAEVADCNTPEMAHKLAVRKEELKRELH